jgi:hypothetical protein
MAMSLVLLSLLVDPVFAIVGALVVTTALPVRIVFRVELVRMVVQVILVGRVSSPPEDARGVGTGAWVQAIGCSERIDKFVSGKSGYGKC